MNAIIQPGRLKGRVRIPCSKSCAHRLLIAAALCSSPVQVEINASSADIDATAQCLRALGARIEATGTGFSVSPIRQCPSSPGRNLFCGESGSTLRFLLPVAAALGASVTFSGAGRLPERPNAPLIEALRQHGVRCDGDLLPLRLSGQLKGGLFPIAGNISSQYITGLLLALPLCAEDSDIRLTSRLESAAYVEITLEVLRLFGITVEKTETGWHIPGGQAYTSPVVIAAEGDWSSAAFWLAANALGSDIACEGLNGASVQGDRSIVQMLRQPCASLDVSDTPDLVPALAVVAAARPGITRITGAARLRIKESDRLQAVSAMLRALGGDVQELADGLVINGGKPLTGGCIDGCNDHRIVMAAAIAATAASGPVTISGAEAVRKSYPAFFEDFTALGGIVHVESDR